MIAYWSKHLIHLFAIATENKKLLFKDVNYNVHVIFPYTKYINLSRAV